MVTSLVIASIGLVLAIFGWGLALLLKVPKISVIELRDGKFPVKIALACSIGGGFALGIALTTLFAAGVWWCFALLFSSATPVKLVLISIIIGPTPLLVSAIASGIASLLGGKVDASGARNCSFYGKDFGPLLHSLFMAYWLVFITGGLAILGLLGSGIWVLLRQF